MACGHCRGSSCSNASTYVKDEEESDSAGQGMAHVFHEVFPDRPEEPAVRYFSQGNRSRQDSRPRRREKNLEDDAVVQTVRRPILSPTETQPFAGLSISASAFQPAPKHISSSLAARLDLCILAWVFLSS